MGHGPLPFPWTSTGRGAAVPAKEVVALRLGLVAARDSKMSTTSVSEYGAQ